MNRPSVSTPRRVFCSKEIALISGPSLSCHRPAGSQSPKVAPPSSLEPSSGTDGARSHAWKVSAPEPSTEVEEVEATGDQGQVHRVIKEPGTYARWEPALWG